MVPVARSRTPFAWFEDGARGRWLEHPFLHLGVLAGLTVYYLSVSWRRWPDAVVDFGRELYVPWQLAEGALLYRDVDEFYGPLSQYVNAALFHVFGPGMMVLVYANLAVFAAIVGSTYFLVRQAWGGMAALGGTAVFVAVFGFSRFMAIGNFNYATPYAHETTHGILILVTLAAVLVRWLERPGAMLSAAAGLLFGLSLVLKPEIIFAAAALGVAAVVLQWRRGGRGSWGGLAAGAGAATAPTAGFAIYFSFYVGAREAWSFASQAWLSVVATTRHVADPVQAKYTGLDQPWTHLQQYAVWTVGFLVVLSLMVIAVRAGARRAGGIRVIGGLIPLAFLGVGLLAPNGVWIESGRVFVPLILAYLGWLVLDLRRSGSNETDERAWRVRVLLTVLAAALLVRMALHGRLYHYGFFQAALAGVVLVSGLLGEFSWRLMSTRGAAILLAVTLSGLVGAGVVKLSQISRQFYQQLTVPMGEGRDRFYTFEVVQPIATVVAQLGTVSRQGTLLVLPEGIMLNYLPRLRSPLGSFAFFGAATEGGLEHRLVERLKAAPPNWVITLPRDLKEYGIGIYGERSGAGGDLMRWVAANYAGAPGDPTPLAYRTDAVQVWQRKPDVLPTAGRRP